MARALRCYQCRWLEGGYFEPWRSCSGALLMKTSGAFCFRGRDPKRGTALRLGGKPGGIKLCDLYFYSSMEIQYEYKEKIF